MFKLKVTYKNQSFEVLIWKQESFMIPEGFWVGECNQFKTHRKHNDTPLEVFAQLLYLIRDKVNTPT